MCVLCSVRTMNMANVKILLAIKKCVNFNLLHSAFLCIPISKYVYRKLDCLNFVRQIVLSTKWIAYIKND